MNLFHPEQLVWAAAAIPIVGCYYWMFRRYRAPTATLDLWHAALALRRPWRHRVSLLAQLVLLTLLVVALAQPYWSLWARNGRSLVLVIDASASMNAADVAPSRFDAARATAGEVVENLGLYDRATVVAAGAGASVRCPLTDDLRVLRQAIDEIEPTDAPDSMADAIRLAKTITSRAPNGHVVVIGDGCFRGVALLQEDPHATLLLHNGKGGNLAITRMSVRPSLSKPGQRHVFAEVANFSDRPAAVRMRLKYRGTPIDERDVELEAGAKRAVLHTFDAPEAGLLDAAIEPVAGDTPDWLSADNRAAVWLEANRPVPVVLVTDGNRALETALSVVPLVELAVTPDPPADMPQGGVAVYHAQVPDRLPAGPSIVVEPAGACDLWRTAGYVDRAGDDSVPTIQAAGFPHLAQADLHRAAIDRLVRLEFTRPTATLAATADGHPIVSEIERDGGNVLVLHAELDKSDLARRRSLPVLLAGAIRRLAATAAPPVSTPLRTAETVTGRAGWWKLAESTTEDVATELPVALLDAVESDIRGLGASSADVAELASSASRLPFWTFLAAAALTLLVLEWASFHRRWTV